ncbi:MAG TPA: AbrB/MazE/SpoVT family DNA-binding domain-containing protein [Bryobacteraceae bacterium]|nr:AbrB/MazE/SpoVT family DNA-binding domain-containing protein [Bryobacteraceae bacterium]
MAIARSKITAQGRISVPPDVRKKLGVAPGSILEWYEDNGRIIVRRAGRFSSEDIHKAVFANRPPRAQTVDAMKAGIRRWMRKRHARD